MQEESQNVHTILHLKSIQIELKKYKIPIIFIFTIKTRTKKNKNRKNWEKFETLLPNNPKSIWYYRIKYTNT